MDLRSLVVDTKSAWIPYPGLEGFEVEVAHLGREKVIEMRKRCTETRFDRKSRLPDEFLNEQKFIKEFTKEAIKNWKGFKTKYLQEFVLLNNEVSKEDLEKEVEFSIESAEFLISKSSVFDQWINEAVFDLDNFRRD